MRLARSLTGRRGGAIYALLACAALALTLYSCSEPPAPQPPMPSPTPLIDPTRAPDALPDFAPLPEDAQFTQIAAGKLHACGLQADGTPLCWGRNISGSLNIPAELTLSRISAGLNFTCALRRNSTIACWGQNDASQASPPNGRFDEIAAGRDHACALNDGALICWGSGFPNGAETVQELPPLSSIQAGFGFTCGLTPNDDMACWYNHRSELSITEGSFVDIGIGLHHACAIKTDGSVFCIEEKPDYYSYYLALSRPPLTKFFQISGGWHHACGITESSDIECWGSGAPGATGQRLSAPEGKFAAIDIGWRNSCALRPNGHAVCWQQPDIHNPYKQLRRALGGVKFDWPVDLFSLPNGDIAVADLKGTIAAYSDEPNAASPQMLLDLTDKTVCCEDDNGLLSAALDPQFEEFPFLYVYYRTVSKHANGENMPELTSRLARFRVESGQVVRDSELTILDLPQPRDRHYGGDIRFGADGMLYLGIGENYLSQKAQALDSLHGKIIRIDVRGATLEQPYRIPPDNPFVNNPEARPEIWAYGLRNPWRMDFASDGRLFIADVGGQTQEEVSIAAAGDNLGWPLCEGNLCHEEGVEADADGLVAPLFAYGREDGCAVVGGVTAPWLNNGFVFGDYCSGRVWLTEEDGREGWRTRILAQAERQLLSFGIDSDGTIYVLSRGDPVMRLQIDVEE